MHDAAEFRARKLIQGKTYRFDPPISGLAVQTGSNIHQPDRELRFSEGWFLRMQDDGTFVFFGKPVETDSPEEEKKHFFRVLHLPGEKNIQEIK